MTSGSCFVIMPFSGWFDDYYTTIYCPAISAAGLTPCRADDLYRPSTIVSDIWEYTCDAKLILADLSEKNPNVFYELGLAHALAKPAILLVETMDDVPFDLRALRILEYDKNDPNWGPLLQKKIEQAIREVLASPNLSVPATFLKVIPSASTVALTRHDKEMLELRQDIDRLGHQLSVRDRSEPGRPPVSRISPKNEIRRLILEGISPGRIVEFMRRRGVPAVETRFIFDELTKRNQHNQELPFESDAQRPSVPPPSPPPKKTPPTKGVELSKPRA